MNPTKPNGDQPPHRPVRLFVRAAFAVQHDDGRFKKFEAPNPEAWIDIPPELLEEDPTPGLASATADALAQKLAFMLTARSSPAVRARRLTRHRAKRETLP